MDRRIFRLDIECIGGVNDFYLVGYQLSEAVGTFKYLGWVMAKSDYDYDWTELYYNMWKLIKCWGIFSRTLGREVVDVQISGMFFCA